MSSSVKVSVVNQTPYTWYFATQDKEYTRIGPERTISYNEARANSRCIHVRYENKLEDSFSYKFNTNKGHSSFILRVTPDRSQIQMHCTSENENRYCPNYDKTTNQNTPYQVGMSYVRETISYHQGKK